MVITKKQYQEFVLIFRKNMKVNPLQDIIFIHNRHFL